MRIAIPLCIFVLCAAWCLTAGAETLTEDKVYEGPVTLEVPIYNIKVKMTEGWRGALPSGAETFVMERSDGSDGKILVLIMEATEAELKQTMQGPVPIGQGVVLQPAGELEKKKGVYFRRYTLAESDQYKASVVARIVDGKAVGAVVLAPAASQKLFETTARKMVEGAASFKPKAPSGAWANKLSNKNLYRFFTGSGYSEKTKLTLCANGSFYRNWDMSSSSQLGTGAGAGNSSGRWTVAGNTLSLSFGDGSSATYSLEERSGSLYMNDKKWLREATRCN